MDRFPEISTETSLVFTAKEQKYRLTLQTVGSGPDTPRKQVLQQSESHELSGFQVHVKVMFTLH